MEIKKDIYYVGVINPTLRIFDIIMKTEYGTSYNAYLIKDEKNVLIETVHESFFDDYIENISSIINIEEIDYLILNHTEPDHTGSVKKLLELNPNITIVTTMAGKKFVSEICNKEFNSIVVKDGQTLNIGYRNLKFIIAPFLHWPDSMFTHIQEDKLLFSCDFLGTHYAEPKVMDRYIKYKEKYDESLINYYKAIFGPFKQYVLDGIEKIKDLQIDTICTSHGPVLQKYLNEVVEKYKEWSTPHIKEKKKITIIYVSAYGYTKKLAILSKEILEKNHMQVEIFDVIKSSMDEILESIETSCGVLVGSPTINRDALKPIWEVLTSIDAISNKGKVFGVFGSYGWSGEAVPMIKQRLESLKLEVFGEGVKVCFNPSNNDLECMEEYTQKFYEYIK